MARKKSGGAGVGFSFPHYPVDQGVVRGPTKIVKVTKNKDGSTVTKKVRVTTQQHPSSGVYHSGPKARPKPKPPATAPTVTRDRTGRPR